MEDNANIIQWPHQGTGNEKWIIQEEQPSGYYTIRNVHSDKYMVVANASKFAGAKIIQYGTGKSVGTGQTMTSHCLCPVCYPSFLLKCNKDIINDLGNKRTFLSLYSLDT